MKHFYNLAIKWATNGAVLEYRDNGCSEQRHVYTSSEDLLKKLKEITEGEN